MRPKQALPILCFIFLLSHHKASMQWTTQPAWGHECCVSLHAEFSACMQQVQCMHATGSGVMCLNAVHRLSASERVVRILKVTVGCLLVVECQASMIHSASLHCLICSSVRAAACPNTVLLASQLCTLASKQVHIELAVHSRQQQAQNMLTAKQHLFKFLLFI